MNDHDEPIISVTAQSLAWLLKDRVMARMQYADVIKMHANLRASIAGVIGVETLALLTDQELVALVRERLGRPRPSKARDKFAMPMFTTADIGTVLERIKTPTGEQVRFRDLPKDKSAWHTGDIVRYLDVRQPAPDVFPLAAILDAKLVTRERHGTDTTWIAAVTEVYAPALGKDATHCPDWSVGDNVYPVEGDGRFVKVAVAEQEMATAQEPPWQPGDVVEHRHATGLVFRATVTGPAVGPGWMTNRYPTKVTEVVSGPEDECPALGQSMTLSQGSPQNRRVDPVPEHTPAREDRTGGE